MSLPVKIIMIEDDEGHARLIERNIRRSGVNNEILPFANGTDAVNYLFGGDGTGVEHKDQALLILLDLNLPDMTGIEPGWLEPPELRDDSQAWLGDRGEGVRHYLATIETQ